jgi:hypothetical protein
LSDLKSGNTEAVKQKLQRLGILLPENAQKFDLKEVKQFAENVINFQLFDELNKKGVRDIYICTDMKDYSRDFVQRILIKNILEIHGFKVCGIITPQDLLVDSKPGSEKVDRIAEVANTIIPDTIQSSKIPSQFQRKPHDFLLSNEGGAEVLREELKKKIDPLVLPAFSETQPPGWFFENYPTIAKNISPVSMGAFVKNIKGIGDYFTTISRDIDTKTPLLQRLVVFLSGSHPGTEIRLVVADDNAKQLPAMLEGVQKANIPNVQAVGLRVNMNGSGTIIEVSQQRDLGALKNFLQGLNDGESALIFARRLKTDAYRATATNFEIWQGHLTKLKQTREDLGRLRLTEESGLAFESILTDIERQVMLPEIKEKFSSFAPAGGALSEPISRFDKFVAFGRDLIAAATNTKGKTALLVIGVTILIGATILTGGLAILALAVLSIPGILYINHKIAQKESNAIKAAEVVATGPQLLPITRQLSASTTSPPKDAALSQQQGVVKPEPEAQTVATT